MNKRFMSFATAEELGIGIDSDMWSETTIKKPKRTVGLIMLETPEFIRIFFKEKRKVRR